LSLAHPILEPVVVGRADLELDVELAHLLLLPVQARLIRRADAVAVVVQHQRRAGLGIAATGIAGLGEQLLRFVD
jgi:hypothetical protein